MSIVTSLFRKGRRCLCRARGRGGGEAGRLGRADRPACSRARGRGASEWCLYELQVLIGQSVMGDHQFVYLASPLPSGPSLAHASAVRTPACTSSSLLPYTPRGLTYISSSSPRTHLSPIATAPTVWLSPSPLQAPTMATVSGPSSARHTSPFRRPAKVPRPPPPAPSNGASGHHQQPIVSRSP